MMKRAASIFILALLASPLQAGNWPSFRGPSATGIGEGEKPPVTWDAEKMTTVVWKTPIPGLGHSSPIVWGDRVFLTTSVGTEKEPMFRPGLYGDVDSVENESPQTWKVLALDRATGKILWEKTAYEGPFKVKRHLKATHANSTPATDGKRLVALFGSEGLYCYDLEGKLLWKKDLGLLDAGWFFNPSYQWEYGSSPVIYKDLVIVQADIQKGSFIAAYDLKDGHEVWKTTRDEIPSWGTPTLWEGKNGVELVTNATRFIRGYDPMTGKELWRLKNGSEISVATPVPTADLIFLSNGYRPVQPIVAIRPGSTGDISLKEGETSSAAVAWAKSRGGTYLPTPIAYGDQFYTLSNDGTLTCYGAKTGEKVYQVRVGGKGASFSASPVAADGKLYLASEDGMVFVVKTGPEYSEVAVNQMGEVMMATPAISGGMLLIRTRGNLFGIAEKK
ncbi:MAG TPA: PQQ-binding-like beta-propeller repeat protein [Candidatus Polarisedimenticolia bacterium]|nr:PQQ-binding-like beta-propeller repeat protein [Candidatus Polarisedimenticolia bacterium]